MTLIQAWVELRQDDLMADWHLASTGETPFKIEPLRQGASHDTRSYQGCGDARFFMNVEFATGEVRRFDMRPYLQFPAFAALKQPGMFPRARIEHGTVVWSEDIDVSPDTLYLRGEPLSSGARP